jgi:hypothetical protein
MSLCPTLEPIRIRKIGRRDKLGLLDNDAGRNASSAGARELRADIHPRTLSNQSPTTQALGILIARIAK